MEALLTIWIISAIISAFITAFILKVKGQSASMGFFAGLLFGVFAILIALFFTPTVNPKQTKQRQIDLEYARKIQRTEQAKASKPRPSSVQPNKTVHGFGKISVNRYHDKMGQLVKYKVYINDKESGKVGYKKELSFKSPVGDYFVYIKNAGGKSKSVGLNIVAGEEVRLTVRSGLGSIILSREGK